MTRPSARSPISDSNRSRWRPKGIRPSAGLPTDRPSDHPILTAGSPGGCQRSRIFSGTRDDYSIDPRFAGRRIGVRVSQTYVTVVMLNTGELACRHRRSFAGGLTFTDFARQTELDLDDSGLPDP